MGPIDIKASRLRSEYEGLRKLANRWAEITPLERERLVGAFDQLATDVMAEVRARLQANIVNELTLNFKELEGLHILCRFNHMELSHHLTHGDPNDDTCPPGSP